MNSRGFARAARAALAVLALVPSAARAAEAPPELPCVVELSSDAPLAAGEAATLRFRVSALPSGVGLAPGDAIEVRFPTCAPLPFTRWAAPQTSDPRAPGFVRVGPQAEALVRPIGPIPVCRGLPLRLKEAYPPVLVVTFPHGLPPGSESEFVYGDHSVSPEGRGRAQKFPEDAARWTFVLHSSSPSAKPIELPERVLPVGGAPPARLHLSGPSSSELDRAFRVRIAALDSLGFPAAALPEIELSARHESGVVRKLAGAREPTAYPCVQLADVRLDRPGFWWIEASPAGPSDSIRGAWSLPVLIGAEPSRRLVFGDLHWHTNRSDGSRSPREGYLYARDVVGLDFTAKTDHDIHSQFLCMEGAEWRESEELVLEFENPGSFAALLGWEWTHPWGHQNVYFRGGTGPYRAIQEHRTPEELWAALPPGEALTIPHHPAGGTRTPSMNWRSIDPRFVKTVEIFSSHGDGEAVGAPYRPMLRMEGKLVERTPSGSAHEALARGYALGYLASTDDHAATPGSPIRRVRRDIDAGPGLCAAWVDSLSRASVFDAVALGDTYATTGPRIRLELAAADGGVDALVAGTADLARVEFVGVRVGGEIPFPTIAEPVVEGRLARFRWRPTSPADSTLDAVILRITQVDAEMAWSSPFSLATPPPGATRP